MIRYQGGKSRLRKHIIPILKDARLPGQLFIDLFIGGGWITEQMENPRIANDIDPDLITLFNAVQHGWEPPTFVSEEMYAAAREDGQGSAGQHIRAFIAFGCSWGGKKWGGYARGKTSDGLRDRNYAQEASNACKTAAPLLRGIQFLNLDYLDLPTPSDALVYADPPYLGTTGYKTTLGDYGKFLKTMVAWTSAGNTVFVSEQADLPEALFDKVWSKEHVGGIRKVSGKPTEKLYRVKSTPSLTATTVINNWIKEIR